MKLLLGKVLIETNHVEQICIVEDDDVLIHFVSGQELKVICEGFPLGGQGSWQGTPHSLMEQIMAYDNQVLRELE